ncbi:Nn.00g071080.m01.CDS01 [Neocucurbitaria sp. VM-36]
MSFPLPLTPSPTQTEKELRRQMPRLQTTSIERKNTTQSRPQLASKVPTADTMPEEAQFTSPTSAAGRLRFVLTDIVAARYIEEDPNTTCEVLARRQKIQGYEIYLVEQWACSRSHPTFLITTYTGNPEDSILATIISVPADEEKWSPQMRLYFKSLTEYHARRKETQYGILMVTNLSGFPSSLTVIPIPGGDLKKYREPFFVNENLKRLGCSGRLGIKLEPPSSATQAKFHQLYRTSEKIPFSASVIELVKLCQVALVLFGKLEPEYADGLLCDVTEKAINDWWIEFGAEYYIVEPHDGILGPTTVAALLGMLMGARNRLSACNSAVAKDVFDIESTKRGIANFQKSHHLPRTRRLDRQTLDKLRRATAKAASKEGWGVPRAFKSTMTELGGKGGEMVMGFVGAGQKDGIAEVETVDIDQFIELVRGDHAKWLWHGKPRKSTSGDMFDRLPGEERSTSPDKRDHTMKPHRRETTLDQYRVMKRESPSDEPKKHETFTPDGLERDKESKDPFSKRAAIKAKSGSGLHHIKNAVGLRSHASKQSRDEQGRHGLHRTKSGTKSPQYTDANILDHDDGLAHQSDDPSIMSPQHMPTGTFTRALTETPRDSASMLPFDRSGENHHEPLTLRHSVAESDISTQPPTVESSVAGSIYHGVDLNENLPVEEAHEVPPLLRRTQSGDQFDFYDAARNDDWWPRHLSFSIAEESVLKWRSITAGDVDEEAIDDDDTSIVALTSRMALLHMQSEQLKRLHHRLALLSNTDTAWVSSRLQEIRDLESAADADIETLDSIYYPRLETYHALREDTHGVVTNNRSQLNASLRELNNVGDKLEYEISALKGKVEDVEDVLVEFERQVKFVENRVEELDRVLGEKEGWWHWLIRVSTGIGKPPG